MSAESSAPEWIPTALLPSFEGNAIRQGPGGPEIVPALWWAKASSALLQSGLDPRSAGEILVDPRALWLVPCTRGEYWDFVRALRMQVWDELQEFCIGVGLRDGLRTPVYDRLRTIRYFQDGFVDASVPINESELRNMALEKFRGIVGYYNGEGTPYFIG